MNKRKLLFLTVLSILGISEVYIKTAFPQSWELVSGLSSVGTIDCIYPSPGAPHTLLIGSKGVLYSFHPERKSSEALIDLGPNAEIWDVQIMDRRIFLLSSEGLFESNDLGKNWSNTFRGTNEKERNVFHISRDPHQSNVLYLGTEGGLFKTEDGARTWYPETSELKNQSIWALKTDAQNQELFAAGEKGLYRFLPRKNRLDRIYVTRPPVVMDETMMEDFEPQEFEGTREEKIYSVSLSHVPNSLLAIGTEKGVWTSEDEGNHWEALPKSGLQDSRIRNLIFSPSINTFFAATEKGVYQYDPLQKHWNELHKGIPIARINDLELGNENPETLYAATDDGLYRMIIVPPIHPEIKLQSADLGGTLLPELFRLEPPMDEIRKEAISYANVSNWKIKRWHWGSRLRSLVPSFSVGKNFSQGDNIDIDRGGTNDPDIYIVGPKDRDESWDMDVKWELSDLIWNSAQTSIDSRDKLMVELRDDILSQVTRLYFERRRAQAEFVLKAPQNPLDRFHALLRIDELTANLDSLTNGFLSRKLKELYGRRPEFHTLWEE